MNSPTRKIKSVVPNEVWQLAIVFDDGTIRLFNASVAREEMGWPQLAYPQTFKHFSYSESALTWPLLGNVTADYLYDNAAPVTQATLEHHALRLSYKNQAPTEEDATHHVYGIYLHAFSEALFAVGESIGGGHAERGGSRRMTLREWRDWPGWKEHAILSGAEWAIPIIESHIDDSEMLADRLVREICRRAADPQ